MLAGSNTFWKGNELEVSRMNHGAEEQGEVCPNPNEGTEAAPLIPAMQCLFLSNAQTGNALEK